MAEIRPFRGVRYNQEIIPDLGRVICPPYDVISPQFQQELYRRSDFNFVRVEYNPETPQDTAGNSRYTRAALTLQHWLEQDILREDKSPALYLYDQYFSCEEKGYRRGAIIAVVKLEDWSRGVIRPHEGTLGQPKQDRINMLRVCQANTSPIMALYQDEGKQVRSLLAKQAEKEPVIRIGGIDAEIHYVWPITDTGVIAEIIGFLAQKPLYIADGHHRYESALAYQHERISSSTAITGEEGFNYAMMALIDFNDPGLVILPPHRLVRGVPRALINDLTKNLKLFFDVQDLPLREDDVWQRVESSLANRDGDRKLVLFGPDKEKLLVLTLRDFTATDRMMPFFRSDVYKRLMVSVVDHVILEKLLEIPKDSEGANLAYSYDKRDAVSMVQADDYQLAFLLSPINPGMVKAIADIGDRMPRKSTYFYPKLPSGLVINRW